MPSITFVGHDGEARVVDVPVGQSLMKAARDADIPGIDADCGGACACATCQVFIDEDWFAATGIVSVEEDAMLDLAVERRPTSRLSCQIQVTPAMEGLRVSVPKSQF